MKLQEHKISLRSYQNNIANDAVKLLKAYDNSKQLEYFEKFWNALPIASAPVVDLANDEEAPF